LVLERQMGFIRVGLVYIVSGFGGNLASSLFLPRLISVGASGASATSWLLTLQQLVAEQR
jgi:membrane associated rhomboid family serine protease